MKTIKISALLLIVCISYTFAQSSGVGINNSGATPHPSAGLDVDFLDKGVLIPRVNDTLSISSPAKGLVIFSPVDSVFYYNAGDESTPEWIMLFSNPAMTSLNMSGLSITNLALPVDNTDAVNKEYVDALAGGGGGPTMVSDESPLTMTFGDAIRHCNSLSENGFSDWYLPKVEDLMVLLSTGGVNVSDNASITAIWAIGPVGSRSGNNPGVVQSGTVFRLSSGQVTGGVNVNSQYNTRCVR